MYDTIRNLKNVIVYEKNTCSKFIEDDKVIIGLKLIFCLVVRSKA